MLFARLLLVLAVSAAAAQNPADDIQPLLAAAQSTYLKGDYEAARQVLLQAWDLAQQRTPEDPIRYDVLRRLTSVRAAAGEFADADNYLQLAINWRETVNGRDDPKIADDLLISVGLCRGMKAYERALAILGRVASMHRQASGPESIPVADDFSRMAQVYMEMKTVPGAISMLKAALQIRTRLVGPLDPSLVPDLDRLAGAHIVRREYDQAEEAYRRALVIRETLLGRYDADLIATVDGLAYACFGQKKYDEAEPIYQRLLDLWVRSLGPEHPMVALAYDKIATFYAEQKKFDQANEATEHSVAIRAYFLGAGLSSAATGQIVQGAKDKAIGAYKRALAVLEPPDPLYEEMRGDITELVRSMEPPPVRPAGKPPAKKK